MARITFPIFRLNFLKNIGGVIDEGLKQGHKINLLYDSTMVNSFQRGLIAPSANNIPKFQNGLPNIIAYEGINKLAETVKNITDVFVTHHGLPYDFYDKSYPVTDQFESVKKAGIPIVSLMSHFYDSCVTKLEALEFFDAVCTLSRHSFESQKQILIQLSDEHHSYFKYDKQRIENVLNNKVHITGSALFDLFERIHLARIKQKQKTDIILFMPKIDPHPYMRLVINSHPRLLSLLLSLGRYQGRYFFEIIKTHPFKKFLKKLKTFALQHDLEIIAKSRPKHGGHYNKNLRKIFKEFITGENDNFYPDYSSAELFKHAKFSIHMRTFSVLEAVISGVPAIHFQIPILNERDVSDKFLLHRLYYTRVVRNAEPDSLFNYSGCVWNVPWKDAIDFLENISPEQLKQTPEKRKEYCEYFCGISEGRAAERQMNIIERFV